MKRREGWGGLRPEGWGAWPHGGGIYPDGEACKPETSIGDGGSAGISPDGGTVL